jgi:D-galactarolactone cycloisomerase
METEECAPRPVETSRLIKIRAVECFVLRAPIAKPVRSALGTLSERPGLLVRVEADSGAVGWGEVWCNFPVCGAQHRANLIDKVLAPVITARPFHEPVEIYAELARASELIAIQAGEIGPFSQAIAGLDIAVWDLWAKAQGQPIWRLLDQAANPRVAVYASALDTEEPVACAKRKIAEGYRAVKLKVGFDPRRDYQQTRELREALGPDIRIMLDANQAWSVALAGRFAKSVAELDISWFEEPIRADAPQSDWMRLAKSSPVPLAAGENMRSEAEFEAALRNRAVKYLQPDIAKWGGFSAIFGIARRAASAGMIYCPHYLGGAVGLIASAHLLVAVGGDGLLEIDSNENRLRTEIFEPFPAIADGHLTLPDRPGLGWEPAAGLLGELRVPY